MEDCSKEMDQCTRVLCAVVLMNGSEGPENLYERLTWLIWNRYKQHLLCMVEQIQPTKPDREEGYWMILSAIGIQWSVTLCTLRDEWNVLDWRSSRTDWSWPSLNFGKPANYKHEITIVPRRQNEGMMYCSCSANRKIHNKRSVRKPFVVVYLVTEVPENHSF